MSLDATMWAWKQQGLSSSEKLLLLSLADRAGETHEAFPSSSRLSRDTGMNIKTVFKVLDRLQVKGIIVKTGRLVGQVPVYKLVGVASRDSETTPKIGTTPKNGSGTKNGIPTTPKIGIPTTPKNGIQNLPIESPIESTTIVSAKTANLTIFDLLEQNPHHVPEQMMVDWLAHRTKIKKIVTPTVWSGLINQLTKIKAELGIEPIEAFETMVISGWQGLQLQYFQGRGSQATPKKKRMTAADVLRA